MTTLLNLAFGLVPILIYAGSIAAGIEDDRRHRGVFLLVYGLWALTLAIGNWLQMGTTVWMFVWVGFGAVALMWSFFLGRAE